MLTHRGQEVEVIGSDGQPADLDQTQLSVRVRTKGSDYEYWVKPADLKEKAAKPSRVVWTDKITGERFSANQDFIERLPSVLGTGEQNILSVRAILSALGRSYEEDPSGFQFANDSRQLRDAKQYLVNEKNVPIVSVQSQQGGYYIANEPNGLQKTAAAFREQASGLIRMAEALEALAENMQEAVR